MAGPITRRGRQGLTRLVFGAAGVIAIGLAILIPAPAAQAWVWSPEVDLWGAATCQTVPNALDVGASTVWLYVHGTGEIVEQPTEWGGYWETRLSTIPPDGSWVAAWMYCEVPGTQGGWRFVTDLYIGRRWIGTTPAPMWLRA